MDEKEQVLTVEGESEMSLFYLIIESCKVNDPEPLKRVSDGGGGVGGTPPRATGNRILLKIAQGFKASTASLVPNKHPNPQKSPFRM